MGKGKSWTKEEEQILINTYHMYTDVELSDIFGVSVVAVKSKRQKLQIYRTVKKEELPEGMKRCCKCKDIRPIDCFNKNKSRPDGLEDSCRECGRDYLAEKEAKKIADSIAKKEEDKLEKYYNKHKNKIMVCKNCGRENTIDDYFLYVNKPSYTVQKKCKNCHKKYKEKTLINRALKNGY